MLINKANERSQGKGGNCTMAIVKLVRRRRIRAYTDDKLRRVSTRGR
jgi:hypothetical protein